MDGWGLLFEYVLIAAVIVALMLRPYALRARARAAKRLRQWWVAGYSRSVVAYQSIQAATRTERSSECSLVQINWLMDASALATAGAVLVPPWRASAGAGPTGTVYITRYYSRRQWWRHARSNLYLTAALGLILAVAAVLGLVVAQDVATGINSFFAHLTAR
ncbi:MAG TPA: hypothetical protein VLF67_05440 [Candidatus Saccharimonas sp.]|nr:hypothetical protein [Candidatus Saccharimonas sp.]